MKQRYANDDAFPFLCIKTFILCVEECFENPDHIKKGLYYLFLVDVSLSDLYPHYTFNLYRRKV